MNIAHFFKKSKTDNPALDNPVVNDPIVEDQVLDFDNDSASLDRTEDQLTDDNNPSTNEDDTTAHERTVEDADVVLSNVAVSVGINTSIGMCQGYKPILNGTVYRNFPFHLLESHDDIVFENNSFHQITCQTNQYYLFDVNNPNKVNSVCSELGEHAKFSKILENGNDTQKHLSTAKSENLTYHQLTERLGNIKAKLTDVKLKSLNRSRKLFNLNKSLELHQRILILIKENSIPQLHELVKTALKQKRSLSYVIQKIVDAVDGVYNVRNSEEDKDLAFLILQYGAPGLLDIVHRALNFPSPSTAYRLLKNSSIIQSSVYEDMTTFIDNIIIDRNEPLYGHMLKVDETYVEPKVRWNPHDNKLYGVCYEHCRDKDLTFSNVTEVEHLADLVKKGEVHVPKESMVIVCSSNSPAGKIRVAAALPTCSKNETDFQANLIDTISSNFKSKYGVPLLNWSTDGDPTRRLIFDSLMKYVLDENSSIYPIMSKLRLVDLDVGRNEETTNFDAKHLSKRLRTNLIGGNFKIGEITLSRTDMLKILNLVPNNSQHSTERLIDPKDKQNVSLATEFSFYIAKLWMMWTN